LNNLQEESKGSTDPFEINEQNFNFFGEINIDDLGGEPVEPTKNEEFKRYDIDMRSNFDGSLYDEFGI